MSALEHREASLAADRHARDAAAEAERGGRVAPQLRATARRQADLAAAHAAAAERLESAERTACETVPAEDVAPGVSGFDVVRVTRLDRPASRFRVLAEGVGFLVATRGRRFDDFAAVVRCRVARAIAERDDSDPFSVHATYVRVYRDDGNVAVVQIVSRDPVRAEEVIRRVRRSGLLFAEPAEGDPDASFDASRARSDGSIEPAPSRPGAPGGGVDPIGGPPRPGGR
jgi:hypothetical protein